MCLTVVAFYDIIQIKCHIMQIMRVAKKLNKSEQILIKLAKRATFTLPEARTNGISHQLLFQLLKRNKVIRLSRGIYAVSGSEDLGQEADYHLAQQKFGREVAVGGLTALFRYQLVDESPNKIWLLVPPTIRTSDKKYRLLRTSRDLRIGIEDHKTFRIASLERALVDAILFQAKIGEETAKSAIIKALRRKLTTPEKIFQIAKQLDVLSKLYEHWPSIQAGLSS